MNLDPGACQLPQPTVIQGEDKTLVVQLKKEDEQEYLDITTATEIDCCFLNTDGTIAHVLFTAGNVAILSGPSGKIGISLTPSVSSLLALSPDGSYSDIEIRLTMGGKLTIVQLPQSFLVKSKLFN
jgi:hypothetical protein